MTACLFYLVPGVLSAWSLEFRVTKVEHLFTTLVNFNLSHSKLLPKETFLFLQRFRPDTI